MELVEDQTFSACDVKIDNKRFVRCKFAGCRFLFHAEGGCYFGDCNFFGDCYLAIHESVCTIVNALSLLPDNGADELFSIIGSYINGRLSFEEYLVKIKGRYSSTLMLNSKIFMTIDFVRAFRGAPIPMKTSSYVDHIHRKFNYFEMDSSREAAVARDGAKYVYLEHESFVNTWVDGGILPLVPMSAHRGEERLHQKMPDENLILNANMPLEEVRKLGFSFDRTMSMFGIENCVRSDSTPIPDIFVGELREEDGLALCFANSLSGAIAARFNRKFCVRIENINAFKAALDAILGAQGVSGGCSYTINHNRNHFLKHIEDAWQDEFRIIWPTLKSARTIKLPPGFATSVVVPEFKNASLDEFGRISSFYAKQLADIDRNGFHKRPVPTAFE